MTAISDPEFGSIQCTVIASESIPADNRNLPRGSIAKPRGLVSVGKEPIGASTLTVSTGPAEADVVCEEDAVGEDPVRLAVGDGPVRLAVREGDVTGFAVVIPALHAARDRPAAQDVTAMAMKRYVFIECLSVSRRCQFKARQAPCHGDRGAVAGLRQRARFRHGLAPGAGC